MLNFLTYFIDYQPNLACFFLGQFRFLRKLMRVAFLYFLSLAKTIGSKNECVGTSSPRALFWKALCGDPGHKSPRDLARNQRLWGPGGKVPTRAGSRTAPVGTSSPRALFWEGLCWLLTFYVQIYVNLLFSWIQFSLHFINVSIDYFDEFSIF